MPFRRALALLVFVSVRVAAQQTQGSRYTDIPSIVIADSAEIKVTDPRVPLKFPLAERQAGVEAAFTAVYVLDATGRVEISTVSFVGTAPRAFRTELCRWLARIQVEPLVREGIRRRAFIVNPFTFALTGGAIEHRPMDTGEALRKAVLADGLVQAVNQFEPLPHC